MYKARECEGFGGRVWDERVEGGRARGEEGKVELPKVRGEEWKELKGMAYKGLSLWTRIGLILLLSLS